MSFSGVLLKVRSSFMYLPTVYGFIAFFLAVISSKIESHIMKLESIHQTIPDVLFTDIELARNILSTISASLLTITTITFSTILVVLTTYLSNFSPRTLQNFLTNHSTQRVLGVFVGGFVYSIMLLLFLEDSGPQSLYIVPSFAILFSIICLFVFVFFIHHVTTWIQVSNLIYNITQSITTRIENDFSNIESVSEDPPWDDWEVEEIKHIQPKPLYTDRVGYIQFIDVDGMVELASRDDCILRIERNINDYVDADTIVLSLWNIKNKDIVTGEYAKYISIGSKQAPYHNIEFGMAKIVEIAVRALSPGINDPNTAINCIDNLGRLLIKLSKKHLPKSHYNDKNRNLRVIFEQPSFTDYLYKSFSQIRFYGSQDITILLAIIRSLIFLAETGSANIRNSVWEFAEYVIKGIDKEGLLSLDRNYLNKHLKKLAAVTEHSKEFKPL